MKTHQDRLAALLTFALSDRKVRYQDKWYQLVGVQPDLRVKLRLITDGRSSGNIELIVEPEDLAGNPESSGRTVEDIILDNHGR
jgi:hypothetical protein